MLPLSKYQWNNRFRIKARFKCLQAYGGKCACCGETRAFLLCIDHVNNDGAKERRRFAKTIPEGRNNLRGGAGTPFFLWLIKNNFPNKERYQVLCFNCNTLKATKGKCNCRNIPWTVDEAISKLESYKPRIPLGEDKHNTKFTNKQAREIIARHLNGEKMTSIARDFGVNHSTISRLVNGKTWKFISRDEYANVDG
jgi:hypothetical protein